MTGLNPRENNHPLCYRSGFYLLKHLKLKKIKCHGTFILYEYSCNTLQVICYGTLILFTKDHFEGKDID